MRQRHRRHTDRFKLKEALKTTKSDEALSQLADQLHPDPVSEWKHRLLGETPVCFKATQDRSSMSRRPRRLSCTSRSAATRTCLERSRRLELKRLRGNSRHSITAEHGTVELQHPEPSSRQHDELLELLRGTVYYEPVQESALDLRLIRLIEAQYLTPCHVSGR